MRKKKQLKTRMFVTKQHFDKSLDDLAQIILQGFDNVQKHVNMRFDQVDQRLERIELRQDQMVYRFEHDELKRRVSHIEHTIGLDGT